MSIRTYATVVTATFLAAVIVSISAMGLSFQRVHLERENWRRMFMALEMVADMSWELLQNEDYQELHDAFARMVATGLARSVYVSDENGVIVASGDPHMHGSILPQADRPKADAPFLRLVGDRWQGGRAVTTPDRRTIGYVNMGTSAEPLLDALRRSRRMATAFGAGAIAVGALLAYAFGGLLATKFRPILTGMQRTISGDLSARVPPSSLSEVRQMGIAFNEMSAALDKRVRDIEAVNQLAADLMMTMEMDQTASLVQSTCEVVIGGTCSIWIRSPISGRLERLPEAEEPLRALSGTVAARALREGRVLTVGAHGADFPSGSEVARGISPRAAVVAPLMTRPYGNVGVTLIEFPQDVRTPKREDVASAAAIANVVAPVVAALQRAQVRERASEMLSHILRPCPIPDIPGMQLAARFRAAETPSGLGGDYYDFIRLDNRAWGIVIGDVAGKGVEAAQYTGMAKYAVRAYALEYHAPAKTLSLVNVALAAQTEVELFITLLFVLIDLEKGSLTFTNAGHPPGLHYHAESDSCTYLQGGGPASGIKKESAYHETVVPIHPGDVIVLLTDGVTEARRDSDLYGNERPEEALKAQARVDAAPAAIADALIDDVTSFCEGRFTDDVALVVLRIT